MSFTFRDPKKAEILLCVFLFLGGHLGGALVRQGGLNQHEVGAVHRQGLVESIDLV